MRGGLALKLPPRYTGQCLLFHVSPLVRNDRAELRGMRNKSNSIRSSKPYLSRLKGGNQMLPALRNVHSVITGCPINYHGQFVSTKRYGSCSGLLIRIQEVWASNSVAEQRSDFNCTIRSLQHPYFYPTTVTCHSPSLFRRARERSAEWAYYTRSGTTGSDHICHTK
jgi:hypothetical protein